MFTNLPFFAFYLGEQGNAGGLMMPRLGTATGRVVGVDQFVKDGIREGRIVLEVQKNAASNDGSNDPNEGELDLSLVEFYVREQTLLPAMILAHANNLRLPAKIRSSLQKFNRPPQVRSFKKIIERGEDIMLLSQGYRIFVKRDDREETDISKDLERLTELTPLYHYEEFANAFDYIVAARTLMIDLAQWSDRNEIQLDLLSPPTPN